MIITLLELTVFLKSHANARKLGGSAGYGFYQWFADVATYLYAAYE